MDANSSDENYNRKTIALFFVFVFGYLLVLILLIGSLYSFTETKTRKDIIQEEKYFNQKAVDVTNEIISQIKSDVLFLERQTALFYEEDGVDFKKRLNATFFEFAISKRSYNQIRFLNEAGKEEVRINFDNDIAKIVSKDKLQDKSDRYYFKEIIQLPDDSVYFSPMDLNIEKDTVEMPFNPVIRIGSPVFNSKNELIGILVVNFFGEIIINKIKTEEKGSIGKTMFLNKDGYYFIGMSSEDEWGFMFNEKKEKNFYADFKSESDVIYKNKNGAFVNGKGIFVYETVSPVIKSSAPGDNVFRCKTLTWKIISFVPKDRLTKLVVAQLKSWWFVIAILSLIFFVLFWFLSRNIILKIATREKLKEQNEELCYAIATKDKFFSIIAHDLRSPFSALLGLAEVVALHRKDLSEEKLNSFLKSIHSTTENIYALLENLLQWAHLQSNKLNPDLQKTNLNDILYENISLFQKIAQQKEITIANEIQSGLNVFIDYQMINTAIRNIISNAVKFTPAGGWIEITAKAFNDDVEIKVKDSGIGMDREQVDTLFLVGKVKSRRGTANEKGTGLGLVLCKEFIDLNNGKLMVESTPGKGTIFYIFLPVAD